jgi:drug/metabolite transporter (DMT)-like permease
MNASIRIGVALAALTALISGIAVWVNSFGVAEVPDAILYTTLKNAVAAGILATALVARVRLRGSGRPAAPPITRGTAALLVILGLAGGGLAFALFFSGLAAATASGAAFIHKTLFVWVALLAVPLLGERLGLVQVGALGVLLAGQVLLAPPKAFGWGAGETMIAAATLIWSVEVIVARRLLVRIPPLALGVARLGIGLLVLGGVVIATGRLEGITAISVAGWGWIALTGALLAGYVATWFAALQRAPASVVTSVLVGAVVITSVLQSASAGRTPDLGAVGAWALVAAAVAIVAGVAVRSSAARRSPVTADA